MEKEKESGMEKLIDLLNEYGIDGDHWSKEENLYSEENSLLIISKSYGFIQWLVENDKIDVEKVYNNSDYPMVKRDEFLYEGLLMLLSIQDEPIRFLCEILK